MSRSSSSDSSEVKANRRIYVTGYSYKEDQHDMKKIFKKYGKIDEFSWKGKYFFVAYSDKDEAKKAVKKMNKEEINGYALIVEFAKHKKTNDSACYNCGKKGHFARNCRDNKKRSSSNSSDKKKKKHKSHKKQKSSSSESKKKSSRSRSRSKDSKKSNESNKSESNSSQQSNAKKEIKEKEDVKKSNGNDQEKNHTS